MDIKENVKDTDTLLRGLLILLFGAIFYITFWIIWLFGLFQFFTKLITGNLNREIAKASGSLTSYAQQIMQYVTFQSDVRPFPFSPWPSDEI